MSMVTSDFGPRDYSDGRTKQAFKDSTDINKMMKKAQTAGSLSHLLKYPEATYGEFDGEFDLLTATSKIAKAGEIFAELGSETRKEFGNDPIAFVRFAADPANNARLAELLPAIAEPGRYFPNPVARGGQGAGAATAPVDPPSGDGGGTSGEEPVVPPDGSGAG